MANRIFVSSDWINGKNIDEDGEHQKIRFWVEEKRKSNVTFIPANFEMSLGHLGEEG